MYTTEPHNSWDQPPIWAVNPPQTVWDPEYLQKLDPRYSTEIQYGRNPPRPSSRSTPTHRKMLNRPDKLRGVETILPDGTIVVPLGISLNKTYKDRFSSYIMEVTYMCTLSTNRYFSR